MEGKGEEELSFLARKDGVRLSLLSIEMQMADSETTDGRFSLLECQQTYSHMEPELKRSLRHKIESLAPENDLYDISFPSFLRTYGYRSLLSASDCVEAVAALLEVANGVRLDFTALSNGGGGGGGALAAASTGDVSGQGGTYWDGGRGVKKWTEMAGGGGGGGMMVDDDKENRRPGDANGGQVLTAAAKRAAKEEAWWVQNFWLAWDALSTE